MKPLTLCLCSAGIQYLQGYVSLSNTSPYGALMAGQPNFHCVLLSLIKRMLIARALGVPVLKVIFGLFCGVLFLGV